MRFDRENFVRVGGIEERDETNKGRRLNKMSANEKNIPESARHVGRGVLHEDALAQSSELLEVVHESFVGGSAWKAADEELSKKKGEYV